MALERRKGRREGRGRKMNGVESKRRGRNEEGVKERERGRRKEKEGSRKWEEEGRGMSLEGGS